MTDPQLLEQLAANPAGPAMAEIARRHVDLVYSAALRQVRDAHLAEDVTQAVFLVLARKASRLGPDVKLSGWLYNTARLTAKNALRAERRRRRHEGAAGRLTMEASMNLSPNAPADSADSSAAAWPSLAPHLDDAMAALNEHDRQLILWRYFENRTHQQTAAAIGVSENTANRRLLRAADKLRRILTGKGVMLSAAALTPLIAAHAVKAAPVGLKIATAGAASASAVAISKGTLTMMLAAKLKVAAVLAVVLLAVGSGTALIMKVIEPTKPVTPSANPVIVPIAMDSSVPATLPVLIDPGSGFTQVARYALVIQPTLADAVRKIATPLKSDSSKFETFTVDSSALLDLLARVIDTPAVMAVDDSIRFAPRPGPGQNWTDQGDYLDFESTLAFAGQRADLRADFNGASTFKLGPNAIDATVNFTRAQVYVLGAGATSIEKGVIQFSGTFRPHTSVIAFGHVGKAPRDVWAMVVWQCFAATPPRMPMVERWSGDVRRWIRSRMNDVLTEADDGVAWAKLAVQAQNPAAVRKEVALTNPACTVRIVGVRRTAGHIFRAWDGTGRPIVLGALNMADRRMTGRASDLEVHVYAEYPDQDNTNYGGSASYVFDHPGDEPFSLAAGVAIGPWQTAGTLSPDRPFTDGAVTIKMKFAPPDMQPNSTLFSVTQDGSNDMSYRFGVVDKAGKMWGTVDQLTITAWNYPEIFFDHAPALVGENLLFDVRPAQFDHVVVLKRLVRPVKFEKVAATPDLSLAKPATATVVAPPPATRPAGLVAGSPEEAMNDLLDAVLANDSAKFRSLMAGTAADQAGFETEFEMISTQRQLSLAAVKQFGQDEIRRVVPDLGGDIDEQFGQLRQLKWTVQGDTATVPGGTNPLKFIRQNGGWKFSPPPTPAGEIDHANARMAGFNQVLADLQAGKFKYVEELADAVHQAENPPVKP